jgi:uncharacterized UPF0160 family protein
MKEDHYSEVQNQLIYVKESNNTLTAELRATKHNFNTLRKNYQKLKDNTDNESSITGKLEELCVQNSMIDKLRVLPREKTETDSSFRRYQKTIDENMESMSEVKKKFEKEEKKLTMALEEHEKIKEAYTRINSELRDNLRKSEESIILLTERNKYLEKELVSSKEKANSYKKKFEDLSVETKLLQETILYKDGKIKRDAERLKNLQSIEQELSKSKLLYKELDETCRQYQLKSDRLTEAVFKEKEKWTLKEASYFETINNLVKEMNSMKKNDTENDEAIGNSLNYTKKLLEAENEINSLKSDIDKAAKREENLENILKKHGESIGIIGILLRQTEEILRCSNCFSSSKPIFMNYPCAHLLCKDCTEPKCKECYSSIQQTLKPSFLESIPAILGQIRMFYNSQGW